MSQPTDQKKLLTDTEIRQLEEFMFALFVFIPTEEVIKQSHLAFRKVGYYTGNQWGKTANVSRMFLSRILGTYPVPKRNVLYFECSTRNKDNPAPHGYHEIRFYDHPKNIKTWERGTWTVITKPEDNKCPYCGADIVVHFRGSRIIRFAAETLPSDRGTTGDKSNTQSREVKNSVYPAFKKWLPDFMIRRDRNTGKKMDIMVRTPTITVVDPWHASVLIRPNRYSGSDIVIEFVSYAQTVRSQAGVQRMSYWSDEESPKDFDEEQDPRLLAEDGDKVYTFTPAESMSWSYDDIFENAAMYIRSPKVCSFLDTTERKKHKTVESTGSGSDVVVIQCSTDDNPTLTMDVVETHYDNVNDPDGVIIAARRYGVFRQASGRIFKDTDYKVHVIDPQRYDITPEVISSWVLGRAIDFHEANQWAVIWAGISPTDECFVYLEMSINPDVFVTVTACNEIAKRSGMDRYALNLIDPLAAKKQSDTGRSTVATINDTFYYLKTGKPIPTLGKKQAECMGGVFQTWRTQGSVGRDAIKERLANSLKCGRPYNNLVVVNGVKRYLPTLWVFNSCRETARSLKHWRLESWADNRMNFSKDRKEKPAARFSHFCTALEALMKDVRFRARQVRDVQRHPTPMYFKSDRHFAIINERRKALKGQR